ncbi:hypothetical protein FKM82_023755 [Ascaphus truei]
MTCSPAFHHYPQHTVLPLQQGILGNDMQHCLSPLYPSIQCSHCSKGFWEMTCSPAFPHYPLAYCAPTAARDSGK